MTQEIFPADKNDFYPKRNIAMRVNGECTLIWALCIFMALIRAAAHFRRRPRLVSLIDRSLSIFLVFAFPNSNYPSETFLLMKTTSKWDGN
jgi:hypothetical protein